MSDRFSVEPAKGAMRHPAALGQATILLVDDFDGIRELYARLLSQAGYRVVEACDAQQAQELSCEEATIDMLVTDFRMPGMNGVDLARWFCKRFPLSPVLLVSGCACELEAYLETPGWPAILDKSEANIRLVPMVEELLAKRTSRLEGLGAAEIAQRASAETVVLRNILDRGQHSGSWLHVVNE